MKHSGPLHKLAPRYSDFSTCEPGMIHDDSGQTPVNIVVIAENKAVARSWIAQTLQHCKPGIETDETHYGRFQFLACAYDQPLPGGCIHEAHVIVDTDLGQDFGTSARRVFFHHIGGAVVAGVNGGIHYLWSSQEAGSAFCGGLFSMVARPGVFGLTWEGYANLLPESAFARGLLYGTESLDKAISTLRDRVAGLPSAKATLAILHIDANDDFSIGDYVDVCSAAEESLPALCRLMATVSIENRPKWFDVQLAIFIS